MKTLLVLRHAKSSWDNRDLSDYERPLNRRGQHDAPRMGEVLKENDLTPDLIIASSAKRARATAEAAATASDYDGEIQFTRQFYHADSDDYIEVLQKLDDKYQRVLIVGHNPGMEYLVALFSGRWERMPTAGLAHLALPITHWHELDGDVEAELVNFWQPKEIE